MSIATRNRGALPGRRRGFRTGLRGYRESLQAASSGQWPSGLVLVTETRNEHGRRENHARTDRGTWRRGNRQVPGTTRQLLWGGVFAGPFFYVMVLIQMLTRPGFDIRRQPLSLLSLGDLGWLQIATFVATGLAGIACAVGMRRALRHRRGGTWGPLLVGLWGLGLIAAGAFHPDPSLGFPPGTAQDIPDQLSGHAILHGVAFFTLFTSLAVACIVFARRFAELRQWNWMAYCTATGVAGLAIVALGMSNPSAALVPFALAGVVAFGWLSVVSRALLSEKYDSGES